MPASLWPFLVLNLNSGRAHLLEVTNGAPDTGYVAVPRIAVDDQRNRGHVSCRPQHFGDFGVGDQPDVRQPIPDTRSSVSTDIRDLEPRLFD